MSGPVFLVILSTVLLGWLGREVVMDHIARRRRQRQRRRLHLAAAATVFTRTRARRTRRPVGGACGDLDFDALPGPIAAALPPEHHEHHLVSERAAR